LAGRQTREETDSFGRLRSAAFSSQEKVQGFARLATQMISRRAGYESAGRRIKHEHGPARNSIQAQIIEYDLIVVGYCLFQLAARARLSPRTSKRSAKSLPNFSTNRKASAAAP